MTMNTTNMTTNPTMTKKATHSERAPMKDLTVLLSTKVSVAKKVKAAQVKAARVIAAQVTAAQVATAERA